MKSDDIIEEEFEVVDGKVSVPTAPGIGVTLDEAKVEKYERDAAEISRFGEKSLTQIPQYGKIL